MVDMGAEVGQKMRSAIKAKLTELDCYVDDELPDYIMVMVANKRTKTQMNEDLSLFLKKKTSIFVDWLHVVLKRLKQVTVTNLDVYKKASKRKSGELPETKIFHKKIKKETMKTDETIVKEETERNSDKSLTDDLPLNVNVKPLAENRKIILVTDASHDNSEQSLNNSSLPEIEQPSLKQLEDIESQIRNVKNRLGFKMDEDVEEAELRRIVENSRKKSTDSMKNGRKIVLDTSKNEEESTQIEDKNESSKESDDNNQEAHVRKEHSKIVFSKEDFRSPSRSPPKKKSVLHRLGKHGDKSSKSVLSRLGSYSRREDKGSDKMNGDLRYRKSEKLREMEDLNSVERSKKLVGERNDGYSRNGKDLRSHLSLSGSGVATRKDVKNRLGLSSKITIPQIDPQLLEDTFKKREVVSVVKVKPRILPPNVQQANKNLLLKAVAEAQKSIAQSRSVGKDQKIHSTKSSVDTTDLRFKELKKTIPHNFKMRKVSEAGKEKLKQFLSSQSEECSDQEYVPTPVKNKPTSIEYVPSFLDKKFEVGNENAETKHKFIVTLDGIQKSDMVARLSVKDRLHGRRTPSPIVFNASDGNTQTERKIPDELPAVPTSFSKKKEKCKYYPLCKNTDQCEYFHPVKMCEQFPYCKFGDKCLYIHPNCKFGTSCTKRDCLFVHSDGTRSVTAVVPVNQPIAKVQICKFFPQCININCLFYHPKSCKFGIYCENQSSCNYIHTNFSSKKSLTWRSK